MPRKMLTDRAVKALKPAQSGKRYDVMDAAVPGLGVRVTDKGERTFVLLARYPGSSNPTRRAIGPVGAIELTTARDKAREWLALIHKGVDPKIAEERARQAELRKQSHTFESVAEQFLDKHVSKLRSARDMTNDLRRVFIPRWRHRPITEIDRHDVLAIINDAVDSGTPYQARKLLALIRKLFGWAVARGTYGLESSPCSQIKPADVIGKLAVRQRVFDDDDWRAFWKASGEIGYPFGPLFRLLALTGSRREEIGSATWDEVDMNKRVLTFSHARMKADAAHVVPLTDTAVAIIEDIPMRRGYLFTTSGRTPVSGYSKAKSRMEQLMPNVGDWRLHDIRRSVRTGLSALGVQDRIAELTVGHKPQGLHKVYDQHAFLDERRDALRRWGRHLLSIVAPTPADNIISLSTRPS